MAEKASTRSKGGDNERPEPLHGTVKTAKRTAHGLTLTVQVQNLGNRALYYISDVRVILFDPSTNRLTLGLSDAGVTLVPGGVSRLPSFRTVDPQSQAEFEISLPMTIVKLAGADPATGEPLFEEHAIADAAEVVMDIGWADTPYYPDPRDSKDQRMPTERWEQGRLSLTHNLKPGKKPPRQD